ncbi:LacI family transcriptional regulator [Microbacterium sp. JZ70]
MTASRPDATLRDVALAAGVSIATASRALSGRGDLSRTTRARVFDAAEALGYQRMASRRGRPTTLDPRLIEFVVGDFHDDWEEAMTSGVRDAAFAAGFDLVLTRERPEPDDDWPARVATRRPSGVIIGILHPTTRQLAELQGLRTPIVLLDPRSEPDGSLPAIGTTDWQGGYDAGTHLADCGYERFVLINGVPQYRFGRARREGFLAALADRRPAADVTLVNSVWTEAPVDESVVRAFTRDRSSVGVFACNDEMALVAYRVAALLGRDIPQDIGVVGYNDEPRAATASPPLTSLRPPMAAMAARAVETIKELREHSAAEFPLIELPTELVVRGSTRVRG